MESYQVKLIEIADERTEGNLRELDR